MARQFMCCLALCGCVDRVKGESFPTKTAKKDECSGEWLVATFSHYLQFDKLRTTTTTTDKCFSGANKWLMLINTFLRAVIETDLCEY